VDNKNNNRETKKLELIKTIPDSSLGDSLLGYYSNIDVDTEETGDCGGYTIHFARDSALNLLTSFVAHEGNCNILGSKMENVIYDKLKDSISFVVPFKTNVGVSCYKFNGNIMKSILIGKLSIVYPDSANNKSEEIILQKQDSTFEQIYKVKDESPEKH
jgi:hypothetical protein